MDDLKISLRRNARLVDLIRTRFPKAPPTEYYHWQESLDAIWALYDNAVIDALKAKKAKAVLKKQIQTGVKRYANAE